MAKRSRTSAGILLYRRSNGRLQVLLAHPGGPFFARKDAGHWTIPKGEVDPGEEPLDVARREFEEETGLGLEPRLARTTEEWSYWLAEAPADAEIVLDAEHDRYEWLSLEDACARCLSRVVADELRRAAAAP